MLININGSFVPTDEASLPYNDSAFLYGDSLFETMKVIDNRVCWLTDHLDRLQRSAELLGMPCDRIRLLKETERTAQNLGPGLFRLRLTLSRGPMEGPNIRQEANAHWVITASETSPVPEERRQEGFSCVFAPNERVNPLSHLPQMKRGNYADCLYARDFARKQGADEALFIDASGHLLEGATSNLFIVEGKHLITPPLGHLVLDGVIRKQLFRLAAENGMVASEEIIPRQRLLAADAAFLTNAVQGIMPVSRLENRPLSTNETWRQLHDALQCG